MVNKKTTAPIRILFSVVLTLALLFFLLKQNAEKILKWSYLIDAEKVFVLNLGNDVSFYKNSTVTMDSIIEKEIDYIKEAIPIVNKQLDLLNIQEYDILFQKGNCSGQTLTQSRLIKLDKCQERQSPFVHEYMHLILGHYDEFWFTEGIATYLSLKITNGSALRNQMDQNTHFFFNAWYTDAYTSIDWNERKELSYIDDLKRKYTRNQIDSIFHFEESIQFDDMVDHIEFYRLASSFCELLSEKYGYQKLIDMARKKSSFNKSIIKIFNQNDMNLHEDFEIWLKQFESSQ